METEIKNGRDLAVFLNLSHVKFEKPSNFIQLMDIVRSFTGRLNFSFEDVEQTKMKKLSDLFIEFEVAEILKDSSGKLCNNASFERLLRRVNWE